MTPQRIQRRRTKGWRMPDGAIYVGRPTKWGNPFEVGRSAHLWHPSGAYPHETYRDVFWVLNADHAVRLYRSLLTRPDVRQDTSRLPENWRDELAGRDLACWCPTTSACHADVLLELANQEVPA